MRIMIALTLAAATLGTAAMPADAAGCLKGAAVGGAAGHFVGRGHAVLGAVPPAAPMVTIVPPRRPECSARSSGRSTAKISVLPRRREPR